MFEGYTCPVHITESCPERCIREREGHVSSEGHASSEESSQHYLLEPESKVFVFLQEYLTTPVMVFLVLNMVLFFVEVFLIIASINTKQDFYIGMAIGFGVVYLATVIRLIYECPCLNKCKCDDNESEVPKTSYGSMERTTVTIPVPEGLPVRDPPKHTPGQVSDPGPSRVEFGQQLKKPRQSGSQNDNVYPYPVESGSSYTIPLQDDGPPRNVKGIALFGAAINGSKEDPPERPAARLSMPFEEVPGIIASAFEPREPEQELSRTPSSESSSTTGPKWETAPPAIFPVSLPTEKPQIITDSTGNIVIEKHIP